MKWLPAIVAIGCWLLPMPSSASVSISEIAWMGSLSNANHEWIELHNSGASAIDVSGWTLTDGANLTIDLSAASVPEISAGAYVTLKRTGDASAPGSTFLIYTGALVNSGATLTLRRGDGTIVDQVVGGTDWQNIGGDNATKDTAQYTPQGWITAAPTPGAVNATTPSAATPASISTTTTTTVTASSPTGSAPRRMGSSGGEPVRLVVPDVSLQLAITGQTIGYVNQLIEFSVTPSGLGDTWLRSLTYAWNFGDGIGTGSGTKASYRFSFPGTYVVTVYGAYGRHEQAARHEITIVPAALSLAVDADGNVLMHNDAPYEVDISGFRLAGAAGTHTFPPRTILLPYQTLTLPYSLAGAPTTQLLGLYDAARTLVASNLAHVSRALPAPLSIETIAQSDTSVVPSLPAATVTASAPRVSPVTPPVALSTAQPAPVVAGVSTTTLTSVDSRPGVEAGTASVVPALQRALPPEGWLVFLVLVASAALWLRPRATGDGEVETVSLPTSSHNPFL